MTDGPEPLKLRGTQHHPGWNVSTDFGTIPPGGIMQEAIHTLGQAAGLPEPGGGSGDPGCLDRRHEGGAGPEGEDDAGPPDMRLGVEGWAAMASRRSVSASVRVTWGRVGGHLGMMTLPWMVFLMGWPPMAGGGGVHSGRQGQDCQEMF